ncbi:MAG TPA: molybdate ABC transporter substrate-binding protein [Pseudonocardia sp.]|uniref:molybdate ABC transporter substrate-binding protein n=1 Tax=Pseudonocardia sp. TaxID=60912 RepID=UPI002F3F9B1C
MRKSLPLAACGLLAAALVAGCASGGPSGGAAPSAGAPPAQQRTLTVSAAASLTDVFNGLEKQFEQQNPGVAVRLNYGGSSDLAQQIVNGAPADVFAAANTSTMDTVSKAGLVNGKASVFVTNTLQIAVPKGDPKGIHTFADLTKPGLKVVVCATQVPCGSATQQVEKATGIMLKPVSEESDVRSALTKVTTGDADAAVVYVTDVRSTNGKVDGVSFPESAKAINKYPIASLKNAPRPDLAAKWVAFVEGPDGKKALSDAGFGTVGQVPR